ncbi:MAG: type II toxin-antitoxin system prevent-host-death family antitoxin [Acidimicrobiales bacterium]
MVTRVVNLHEAMARLSELIREAENGVEVIVTRDEYPVAKIVPWQPDRPVRSPGAWAGRVRGSEKPLASDGDVVALFGESANDPAP